MLLWPGWPGQQYDRASTSKVGADLNTNTILAFVVSLLLQVGFPLAVTLIYRRRTVARWLLFAYGAIVFAVFQLFTWLPLSVYLDVVVGSRLDSELGAFAWLLASALATSLVEES
ncbi:MAG: YhfC family intramembrane metalloprotease, partial [Anaerolineales bacterium]